MLLGDWRASAAISRKLDGTRLNAIILRNGPSDQFVFHHQSRYLMDKWTFEHMM